jgi:hypothetical protein
LNKIALVAGTIAVACIYWLHVGSYFDGLEFTKSWRYPMVGVPLLATSVAVYLLFTVLALIAVVRKTKKVGTLVPLLVLPILFFGSYYLPIPRFVDGLHDAVTEKLDPPQLLEMAEFARALKEREEGLSLSDELTTELQKAFPKELSLSRHQPYVSVDADTVDIVYGGALTKHWGYAVIKSDTCPRKGVPESFCRKVFDNVWVYQDIW